MSRTKGVSTVAVLLALLFALAGCGKSEQVTVPNVKGEDPKSAYETLHKAGLQVSTSDSMRYRFGLEEFLPHGQRAGFPPQVQRQTPQAGHAVARESVVEITTGCWIVAGGVFECDPYPEAVPDLIGETLGSIGEHEHCFSLEAKLPPLDAANQPGLLDNYVVIGQSPAPGEQTAPISASNPPGQATLIVTVRAAG